MRTNYAIKNIISKAISTTLIAIIGFVSRRVFADTLGDSVLGLSGLMGSIISMLSLMELGVGNAIYFSLYKPLADGDEGMVNAIMNLYRKLYRYIGIAVAGIGICVVPFMQLLVKNQLGEANLSMAYVYQVYALFLIDAVMSYFLAYRRNIFCADQKEYMVTNVVTVVTIIYTIAQIVVLKTTGNYFIYLMIGVGATIGMNAYFYIMSNVKYPCLKEKVTTELSKEYKDNLVKNVKALFMMNLAVFLVSGTDNMLLTYYVGLTSVAVYGCYKTIFDVLDSLFNQVFNSIGSSVGNYLVTEDIKESRRLFDYLFFANFIITGFVAVGMVSLSSKFISQVWMSNSEYQFTIAAVCVLAFNNFTRNILNSVTVFQSAAGLYSPYPFYKYWSFTEGVVNLVVSMLFIKVFNMGVLGVFLGTSVSTAVSVLVTPQVTFTYIFKENFLHYYKGFFKYLGLTAVFCAICYFACSYINTGMAFLDFIIGGITCVIIMALGITVLFGKTEEFNFFKNTILDFIKRRKNAI